MAFQPVDWVLADSEDVAKLEEFVDEEKGGDLDQSFEGAENGKLHRLYVRLLAGLHNPQQERRQEMEPKLQDSIIVQR